MELKIRGGTKHRRRIVRDLAEWLVYTLLREKTANQIDLVVHLRPHLVKREGVFGSICRFEDDVHRHPRCFHIDIDARQSLEDLKETLCHEAVHLQQYATGKLQEMARSPRVKFARRYYGVDLAYSKQPWEQEAERRSHELLEQYKSR